MSASVQPPCLLPSRWTRVALCNHGAFTTPAPSSCRNLAVGGGWPGPPNPATPFPATMAVEYVHVWGTPE